MEKAKISVYHIFVLIFLFEAGSVFLVSVGREARQDAWITVLFGLFGGLFLFWVFYKLYEYYPDVLPTTFVREILGKYIGGAVAFIYMLYFTFSAAVVLRIFGEYMITFSYPETPMFVINLLLMGVMIYAVRKGIEVIGRTGELLFYLALSITIFLLILLAFSTMIDFGNLSPVFEKGLPRVLKVTLTETLYVPFGELVVFALLLPYVKKTKKMKLTIFLALITSGLTLTGTKILNLAVLGPELSESSVLPVRDVIQTIDFLEYLQRLDVFFILLLVVGAFVKCLIFFYVAVSGTADLFKVKRPASLALPIGSIILITSIFMTRNIVENRLLSIKILPMYVHLPFQLIFPVFILILAFFKNRKKKEKEVK